MEDILEKYKFTDEYGHPLELCQDYIALRAQLAAVEQERAEARACVDEIWAFVAPELEQPINRSMPGLVNYIADLMSDLHQARKNYQEGYAEADKLRARVARLEGIVELAREYKRDEETYSTASNDSKGSVASIRTARQYMMASRQSLFAALDSVAGQDTQGQDEENK